MQNWFPELRHIIASRSFFFLLQILSESALSNFGRQIYFSFILFSVHLNKYINLRNRMNSSNNITDDDFANRNFMNTTDAFEAFFTLENVGFKLGIWATVLWLWIQILYYGLTLESFMYYLFFVCLYCVDCMCGVSHCFHASLFSADIFLFHTFSRNPWHRFLNMNEVFSS